MSTATHSQHTNRLSKETSPYLLQHQHNPVDWYPWGPEAFEAARREDKPIFLSVGYSTCYWCHVMERQSFENEQIAQEMNQRFINIKVDREERPDVDQLYMTAVQVLTRHGGWPMSVFLTPDLRPFWGGTYFPPTDTQGRPGFVTVLRAIEDAYRNRPDEVRKTADQLENILQQAAEPVPPTAPIDVDEEFIDRLVDRSAGDYDPANGGFGGAPKFPRETLLELLLAYASTLAGNPDVDPEQGRVGQIMKMVRHTLDAMAHGGIRDQLGGGFHRYSTDAKWLVPHFEIMLYDNAMLAYVYAEAYRQTEDRRYAGVARGIIDFVLREMTSPEGAFYTAFDAEVDALEGKSYLWTADEIESILGPEDARLFNRVYGVDRGPNFEDPHHGPGHPDQNILYLPEPVRTVATEMGMTDDELEARLQPLKQKLYDARLQRKQPLLDTKIITSWNALMIRALAHAGGLLAEPRYLNAAARAADFLLRHHRMPDGGLYRTSREGKVKYEGFLDDYAFLMHALIELRDASGKEVWKDHAASLAMQMISEFGDDERGGFYFTSSDSTDLFVRQKIASDSPLPSGNAVAAMAMIELGQHEAAQRALAIFTPQMSAHGEGMSSMVQAALHYTRKRGEFRVEPAPRAARAEQPMSPAQLAGSIVSVKPVWAGPRELHVHLNVLRGFHINSHFASDRMIATDLSVIGDAKGEVNEIEYPPGEEQRFAFAPNEPIQVYDEEAIIIARFKSDVAGRGCRLSLRYQACDDNSCLQPVTKQVEVPPR